MEKKQPRRKSRLSDPFRFDRAILAHDAEERGLPPDDLRLAGADEVGRGCLAGPLVVAAVVLDYSRARFPLLDGLTDSKLLTLEAREVLYRGIMRTASRVSWAARAPRTIDNVGLHRCNIAALSWTLESLRGEYRLAIVDGFDLHRPDLHAKAIVDGDYKSAAVAAASVVAKVVRDRLMRAVAPSYSEYGFDSHVGYATSAHREALRKNGPCELHRLSFSGVGNRQLDLWEEP
jgi:ribonuclease HII